MLIKVTAIIETVVYVETDDFDEASIKAKKIVEQNCHEALREDIGNDIFNKIPLATQKINKITELPQGWDAETIPWGSDDIHCWDELTLIGD